MSSRLFAATNLALSTSGNEYALTIPPGAMQLRLKCRDATNALKFYTVSVGNQGSPSNYFTLNPGTTLTLESLLSGQTIYVMPPANSLVLEVAYLIDQ